MAEPTLIEVFGASAAQTSTTLTITKADLPGLNASGSNTAESLLVAIILKAKTVLTTANQGTDPLRQVTIEDGFESLVTRGGEQYRQKTMTVALQKADASSAIDPDDY